MRRTTTGNLPRRAALLMAAIALLAGLSCREHVRPAPAGTTIVTSFYPVYIATINVAAEVPGVTVVNMTPPFTGCLHDYQMTPQDMAALDQASALVVSGAGMEPFLDKVIATHPKLLVIDAGAGIEHLPSRSGEGHNHGGTPNPHVWVSVSNAITQARNIGEGLAHADTAHAARYRANAAAYAARLDSLRVEMHRALDSLARREVVTFHEAFDYFAREFGLTVAAVVQSDPGSEPSAADIARTVDLVRRDHIAALFTEPQYAPRAAETIAAEAGTRLYVLDPAATGPVDPDAYITIMRSNAAVLREALGAPAGGKPQ